MGLNYLPSVIMNLIKNSMCIADIFSDKTKIGGKQVVSWT